MRTCLLLRVDGDTYAVEYRGDTAAAISEALDLALPDPWNTIHAAIVEASDVGAARFAPVPYWIGTDDTDSDHVADVARCMDIDHRTDVDAIVAVATSLVAALATYRDASGAAHAHEAFAADAADYPHGGES